MFFDTLQWLYRINRIASTWTNFGHLKSGQKNTDHEILISDLFLRNEEIQVHHISVCGSDRVELECLCFNGFEFIW